MNKTKSDLLSIFQQAITAVAGKQVVAQEFSRNKYTDKYHVVAIGKAADAMVLGLPDDKVINGIVISKHGHISEQLQQDTRFICIESDHPMPKQASILAGEALLDYLTALPKNAPCLFLISGGTSALVEVLQDGWTLADLTDLTNYLLANDFSIAEINAVRRKISKIKGGGLWHYLGDRPVTCLMISDVPNDNPVDIGSGLLFPDTESSLPQLPSEWSSRINPVHQINLAPGFDWKIIASLSDAKQAAAHQAKKLGYSVRVIAKFVNGKAVDTAQQCVDYVMNNPHVLYIWGGETTVTLPSKPGKGGRNQHLALAAAIQMDNTQNCYLLAAGTDGTDGLSSATGALVDSDTVMKGKNLGLDASEYLEKADSNSFFQATDELIMTGATGTNVMDLVLAIKI